MSGLPHRNGKKAGGRHTTLIDAAEKVYDFIEEIPAVSRICAGQIKMNLPNAPHRVIVKEATGCICVKVRGTKSIQDFKVYSQDPKKVMEIIQQKFPQ